MLKRTCDVCGNPMNSSNGNGEVAILRNVEVDDVGQVDIVIRAKVEWSHAGEPDVCGPCIYKALTGQNPMERK